VRLADVQPGPALELFISGTQWIDAFPGRLAPHVDRLAAMLADEEGRDLPVPGDVRPAPRNLPKWAMPLGAAAAVLLVLGAGLVLAGATGAAECGGPRLNADQSGMAP
jgi:hypothetical protein